MNSDFVPQSFLHSKTQMIISQYLMLSATKRRVIRFTENFVLKQANSVGKLFFTYFHRLVENEDYIGQKGEI